MQAWPAPSAPRVNEVQHKRTKTGGTLTTTKYAPPPGYVPPVAHTPAYAAWPYAAPGYNPQAYYDAYAQAAAYNNYAAQYNQYYQQQAYYAQAAQATHQAFPTTPYPHQELPKTFDFAAHTRSNSAPTVSSDAKQNGPNDDLDENDEEYCEFTRPCYYATRESEIVKELSIGLVHAHTARPANKALPATWTELNEIASLQKAPEPHDPTCCVSLYHSDDVKAAQLVAVRGSDLWELVKGDVIFRIFPIHATTFVSRPELRQKYRNRVDQAWLDAKPDLKRPRPEPQRSDSGHNKKRIFSQTDAAQEPDAHGKRHRQSQSHQPSQEEILARLGVTGSAKPVQAAATPTQQVPSVPKVRHKGDVASDGQNASHDGDADGRSSRMDVDEGKSSVDPPPPHQAQRDSKRSYEQSGFANQGNDADQREEKRRR